MIGWWNLDTKKGENGIPERKYLAKGKANRTHHVHIFQTGNEHIKLHLDFKNYFIQNPEMAKRYGELKVALAKQFPEEHDRYQQGKQSFVNEVVRKIDDRRREDESTGV
ncbi:hypothetical protein J8TS2_26240 [Lederbergia ruris]|uniref:GrpB family protein n=1 Tax=Lederbergia ruris TaxID=217495 RepID=A0ABQ4KK17_9BACI|nr:hypothetical protein J8TS2_26240 [Lederbergia ruris]